MKNMAGTFILRLFFYSPFYHFFLLFSATALAFAFGFSFACTTAAAASITTDAPGAAPFRFHQIANGQHQDHKQNSSYDQIRQRTHLIFSDYAACFSAYSASSSRSVFRIR